MTLRPAPATKRDKRWVGYKVHVTETCDEEPPHLITHVETTTATSTDEAALEPIHQALNNEICYRLNTWSMPAMLILLG